MSRTRQPSNDMPEGNSSAELTAEREFAKRELAETLQTLRKRADVPERSKQVMQDYFGSHRPAHATGARRSVAMNSAIGIACAVAVAVGAIGYWRNRRR